MISYYTYIHTMTFPEENTTKNVPEHAAWNDLDEYTLTLMSNKSHYKKYINSKIGPNGEIVKGELNDGHSIHYDTTFRKERKYYKKRVLALTKDLINKKCDDKEILDPFQEYLKCCIKYLKFKDIADMIQSEHTTDVGIDISSSFVNAQSILDYRIENTNIDLQQERDDCDVNDVNDDGEDYERDNQSYNKIVMKIPDMRRSTMDSYVTTMKNVAPPPKMILPQIKEFNIDMMNNAEKKQKKVRKQ
jgi:hypothetical protein